MGIEKYEPFELEDFLNDDYFCHWVLHPDSKSITFWDKFQEYYPEKRVLLHQAKEVLLSIHQSFDTEVAAIPKEQAKASFDHLSSQLDKGDQPVSSMPRRMWWQVAAAILFMGSIAGYFYFPSESAGLSYATGNGQRMDIVLPDNSHIQLNANSTLSYSPDDWQKKGIREVNLEGEAYFKVSSKKEGTKFVVRSGELEVAVLGTEFNVRSRGVHSEVVLAEGKIELNVADQKITMKPGDLIAYSQAEKAITAKKVKPSDYIAWKDGIIVLNKNLNKVVQELEILYGVKFTIEKEALKNRLIQLSAPADSLQQVLEILETMYGEEINIELQDKQVRIY